jgi:hypothetical protein
VDRLEKIALGWLLLAPQAAQLRMAVPSVRKPTDGSPAP